MKLLRTASAKAIDTACRLDSRVLLTREEKELLARNRRFCDQHKGRRAFVLGNGPSLNQLCLDHLEKEVVFAVNGFACHPIIDTWQPAALALADPLYFEKHEAYAGEFQLMRAKLPTSVFFLPLVFHQIVSKFRLLPAERCFYASLNGNMAYHRRVSVDLTGSVPGGQTVTLFAIQAALYMGCNPIYLIGMDHDFLANPKSATHFSSSYESTVEKEYQDQHRFTNWNYLDLIHAVGRMFQGYVNIRRVAEARGQKVFNATAGGFLDVFPRVDFDQLF